MFVCFCPNGKIFRKFCFCSVIYKSESKFFDHFFFLPGRSCCFASDLKLQMKMFLKYRFIEVERKTLYFYCIGNYSFVSLQSPSSLLPEHKAPLRTNVVSF